ncbi:LutC/YkgG family protein [Pontibacillus litoralis]|uniref:Lactate utilization protein C n=1 Tax=Pontibacillus litoralis JSM 072002 TaxID=1385512 RepID=A0A0A5G377_9BACI|nr:lactate utilization protein C [Pontibacillus litoralis]KGX85588.1 hypothetical protein N784_08750 [Pontibacillus litoralis JSM 072002]
MSIQNREAFLNNVASKLGRNRLTEPVERPTYSVQPQWRVFAGQSQDELVNRLEEQCEKIHTVMKRTTLENLNATLTAALEDYNGQSIVAAKDERNEQFGLSSYYASLKEQGKDVHVWDVSKGKENIAIAEKADVGITFSDITLAESGTVTLFNNKGNGRSISLLPQTYIAVIPKSTIVPRMSGAGKHIHEANQEGHDVSSCVSFITGPSNSADIEMNLIVGVHGPVKATYIVVEDM